MMRCAKCDGVMILESESFVVWWRCLICGKRDYGARVPEKSKADTGGHRVRVNSVYISSKKL